MNAPSLQKSSGVMVEENVNIVVHGHDPSLSEMICEYADSKEMIDYAKSVGAKGITVSEGRRQGCKDAGETV